MNLQQILECILFTFRTVHFLASFFHVCAKNAILSTRFIGSFIPQPPELSYSFLYYIYQFQFKNTYWPEGGVTILVIATNHLVTNIKRFVNGISNLKGKNETYPNSIKFLSSPSGIIQYLFYFL